MRHRQLPRPSPMSGKKTMSKGIFIVGTGTDVGKTYVTALICKKIQEYGLRQAYYKAAMSGNSPDDNGKPIPGDALYVQSTAGMTQPLDSMCPYVFETAVSPHLASRIEKQPILPARIMEGYGQLKQEYDYITAEGSGGILCPIIYEETEHDRQELWLEDIIRQFHMPVLLVADAGLGTINSVVLTVEYINKIGLPIRGIIMNHYHKGDVMEEDNIKMVEKRTGIPVLACVEDGASELIIDIHTLLGQYGDI